MRVACQALAAEDLIDDDLLAGLATAAGVFYNYSGEVPCFNYRQAVASYFHGILVTSMDNLYNETLTDRRLRMADTSGSPVWH